MPPLLKSEPGTFGNGTLDLSIIETVSDEKQRILCITRLNCPLNLNLEGINQAARHLIAKYLLLRLQHYDDSKAVLRDVPPFEGNWFSGYVLYLSDPSNLPEIIPVGKAADKRYPYLCDATVWPLSK